MTSASPLALISGTSTGIGRAATLRLVQAGWRVLTGVRRDEDGAALRRAAGNDAERIEAIALDVTRESDIAQAAARVRELAEGAGLAALVNNAGVIVAGPVESLPMEKWRRQFEINFFGTVALTRAVMPDLLRARGRVVNISSIGGLQPQPLIPAYTASKFAIEAMSDSLRMEMKPHGVQVTLVEPGAIRTAIWGKGLGQFADVERDMTPEQRRRHATLLRGLIVASARMEQMATPAERVAEVIYGALTARRAPARRLVGLDARVIATLRRWLPERLMDSLMLSLYAREARRDTPLPDAAKPGPGAAAGGVS